METFTQQDLTTLEMAGVTLEPTQEQESEADLGAPHLRAARLSNGDRVQVQLVPLGTGEEGSGLRSYWYEVIQRSSHINEPGLERLIRSVDLGDTCALIVKETIPFSRYLREQGGGASSVFDAVHTLGLALISLAGQGLTTNALGVADICVTPNGTAQIRIGTEFSIAEQPSSTPSSTHSRRRFGPVSQLHQVVVTLEDQKLVEPHGLIPLHSIFDELLNQEDGDSNTGDLLVAVNKHLRSERAAAVVDLVRKSQEHKEPILGRTGKLLVAAGGVCLIASAAFIAVPKLKSIDQQISSEQTAAHTLTAQEEANNQETLIEVASDLVRQRFELIADFTVGAIDVSNVAQVVTVDSPADQQLVTLLGQLRDQKTQVLSPQVVIESARVLNADEHAALVRIKYQVTQTQLQNGQELLDLVLVEEVDLTLSLEAAGWRISAAGLVGP